MDDRYWMGRALAMARLAAERGEVPIGAVVVRDGVLLGAAHDGKELFKDPTAHAEVLALRHAAAKTGDWRLDGCDLYVTLEPCGMCALALVHARIRRLVYGPANPRWGACSGATDVLADSRLNHRVAITAGILEVESAALLRETFRRIRSD